jgi:hypothetical protein
MEHGDVTQRSELKLANNCMRLDKHAQTKASSTPFQTAANASSTVPLKDSEAKKVMSNHIASGFVTDGMAAKEDYNDKRPSKGSTVDSTPNNRVGGRDGT